jgi:sulfate permease, SulP family
MERLEEENDPDRIDLKKVPSHTKVYEISGPLFFAAADKILEIPLDSKDKCLILRMRSVNAIDATALRTLDRLLQECKKRKIIMILSHVNMQPLTIMKRAGFDERVGNSYFCNHIDEALELAESLQ